MQPIIRRTITIIVTETWTITWPDGQETVWHTTQVVDSPVDSEPSQPRSQLINDDDGFKLDVTDPSVGAS